MNHFYPLLKSRPRLVSALCGSLLIGLPAISLGMASKAAAQQTGLVSPRLERLFGEPQRSNSPGNPSTTIPQAPGSTPDPSPAAPAPVPNPVTPRPVAPAPVYPAPLPGSTTEPATPTPTSPVPDSTTEPATPPLPETQQAPSTTIQPLNGRVNIQLNNETAAAVNYQVIGDTNQRSLAGKSAATLQDLKVPTTLTFKRQDGGLLQVTTTPASEQGTLEVTLRETTDLGTDKSTLRVQEQGGVYLY